MGNSNRLTVSLVRRLASGTFLVSLLLVASLGLAGEYDAEIAKHREIIAKDPTNLDAAYQLGNFLAWDAQYDEAMGVFKAILEKEPGYKDADIGIARVYAWKGDQTAAARKYEEILTKDPKNFEAYQGLGSLALWVNDFEKAIGHFKKALAVNPEDIVSLKGIGRAYLGRGDRRQAEESFTRAEILEIKKTPLPLILAVAGGGFLVIAGTFVFIRSRIRNQKKKLLKMELKVLRYALGLYHLQAGKFPLAAENLLQEKWRPPGSAEEKPYLDEARMAERGFLVDPFGKRYWYNPDTGGVYSTMKGCEEW